MQYKVEGRGSMQKTTLKNMLQLRGNEFWLKEPMVSPLLVTSCLLNFKKLTVRYVGMYVALKSICMLTQLIYLHLYLAMLCIKLPNHTSLPCPIILLNICKTFQFKLNNFSCIWVMCLGNLLNLYMHHISFSSVAGLSLHFIVNDFSFLFFNAVTFIAWISGTIYFFMISVFLWQTFQNWFLFLMYMQCVVCSFIPIVVLTAPLPQTLSSVRDPLPLLTVILMAPGMITFMISSHKEFDTIDMYSDIRLADLVKCNM
jgi:hypothetical protein